MNVGLYTQIMLHVKCHLFIGYGVWMKLAIVQFHVDKGVVFTGPI
jgi:hypothetical protein